MPAVLIVDDNPDLAAAVAALAKASGCDGVAAHSVPDALKVLAERPIDVVILDYHMPAMSGLEFLKDLRARGVKPTAPPVVVCSADDSVRTEALALGAVEFIGKDRHVWTRIVSVMEKYARCSPPE